MDETWAVRSHVDGNDRWVELTGPDGFVAKARTLGGIAAIAVRHLNRLEADAKLAREMRENLTVGPDDLVGAIQPNAWYNDWCARYDAAHGTPEQEVK